MADDDGPAAREPVAGDTSLLPGRADPVILAGDQEDYRLSSKPVNEMRHVVDAHNGLAGGLIEARTQLSSRMEAISERLSAGIDKLERDHLSLKDEHGTKLDELRTLSEENRNALETMVLQKVDELMSLRSTDTEARLELEKKVSGLENSMSDVVGKIAELASIQIPNLQAEFDLKLHRTADELRTENQTTVAATSAVSKRVEELASLLDKRHDSLEARLTEIRTEAVGGVEATKSLAQKCADDLAAATDRLEKEHEELSKRLAEETTRLEEVATAKARQALDVMRGDEGKRLAVLEGVVKQGEFERLSFQEKLAMEIAAIRDEIRSCEKVSDERVQESETKYREEFEDIKRDLQERAFLQKFESFKNEVESSLTENGNSLASLILDSEQQKNEMLSVRDHFDVESRQMKEFATGEARSALEAARKDERWDRLSTGISDAEARRSRGDESLAEQLNTTKSDMTSIYQRVASFCEESNAETKLKVEATEDVVAGLGESVQELVVGLQRRDDNCNRLERIIREFELRKWPWRCNMAAIGPFPQYERQRSNSPPQGRTQQQQQQGVSTMLPQDHGLAVIGSDAVAAAPAGIAAADAEAVMPRTPNFPRPQSASRTHLRHQRVR